jgi:Uma2 family endonuclease
VAVFMTTSEKIPPLYAGDVLTRDEFERRYSAMPHVKKAELVEGVVYMGSPVRHTMHGRPDGLLAGWLSRYAALTPGVDMSCNATVRLDLDNEPQPDLLLRLPEHAGGRSRVTAEGFLEGPPELIVEVAASSASYDLHQKLGVYRRSGVLEYLVLRVEENEFDWFLLAGGNYVRQSQDPDGLSRSRCFPGLVLDVAALLRGDLAALHAGIDAAVRTPEHAAMLVRLRSR